MAIQNTTTNGNNWRAILKLKKVEVLGRLNALPQQLAGFIKPSFNSTQHHMTLKGILHKAEKDLASAQLSLQWVSKNLRLQKADARSIDPSTSLCMEHSKPTTEYVSFKSPDLYPYGYRSLSLQGQYELHQDIIERFVGLLSSGFYDA